MLRVTCSKDYASNLGTRLKVKLEDETLPEEEQARLSDWYKVIREYYDDAEDFGVADLEAVDRYREAMRKEFGEEPDELKKGRISVKICDIRRKLDCPCKVFDYMLVSLLNAEVIELRVDGKAAMTSNEVKDCFVDGNGFRRGAIT